MHLSDMIFRQQKTLAKQLKCYKGHESLANVSTNPQARESKTNVFDGLLLPAILQRYGDAEVSGFIPRNGGEDVEQKENVDHPMDFTQRSQSFIP